MRSARERAGAAATGTEGNGAEAGESDGVAARSSAAAGDGASPVASVRHHRPAGRRVLAAALALTILAVAGWALLGPTVLVVRHVRVTGGGTQVPAAAVRSAAAIKPGTPLARLDAAAVQRRVERIPQVLSARVTRSLPDTVVIAVRPRVPALAVPTAAGYALIDAYGVTVSTVAVRPAGMALLTSPPPVLRGNSLVRAAALVVGELPAQLRAEIRSVSVTRAGVTLRLTGGIIVVWGGPAQGAQKAAELGVLLGTHARYYDVSDPATAVTQP